MFPTLARLRAVVVIDSNMLVGAALRVVGAETVAATACAIALFVGRVAAQVQNLAKEWAQCHRAAYNESHAVWTEDIQS